MINYIKQHERYVFNILTINPGLDVLGELLVYHDKQILWMQQERLVHLITMLFVCLFFLMSFGFTMTYLTLPYIILTALLLILVVAYILHYYRLENSIQRWYVLSNKIRANLLQSKQSQ